MCRRFFFLIMAAFSIYSYAQDSLNSGQWFNKAQYYLFNGQHKEASAIYKMLLSKDTSNKLISFHLCLTYINQPAEVSKALPLLIKTFGESYSCILTTNVPTLVYLGNAYSLSNEIIVPEKKIAAQGFRLDPNQPYSNMCISENGKTMVFMNSNTSKNKIYYTLKDKNVWTKPKEITAKIGGEGNVFPASLSYDGARLYLTKYDEFESDIYVSLYNGKTWQTPKKLNTKINSLQWDAHACESADGMILYFASSRSGGFGGMDIYFSNRAGGEWGEVYNAGARINTFLNEDYPLVLNQGQTLLYASQGFKKGRDGYDMYFCHKAGENWTEPENFGAPVNSPEDDVTYIPMTDECRFFFSKTVSKKNSSRINEDIDPKLIVTGNMKNISGNNVSESAYIEVYDNNSGLLKKTTKPNSDGMFSIPLFEGVYNIKFTDSTTTWPINVAVPLIFKTDTLSLGRNFKK